MKQRKKCSGRKGRTPQRP